MDENGKKYEHIDEKPIKETCLKPRVLNELNFDNERTEKKNNLKFYDVDVNLPSTKPRKFNLNDHYESVQSHRPRNPKAGVPYAVWEDVSSPVLPVNQCFRDEMTEVSENSLQGQNLNSKENTLREKNSEQPLLQSESADSINSVIQDNKRIPHFENIHNEEEFTLEPNLKSNILGNEGTTFNLIENERGKRGESSNNLKNNMHENEHLLKPPESNKSEVGKDFKCTNSSEGSSHQPQRLLERKPKEQSMKRIHAGRIESSNKDLIRDWKRMENVGAKLCGSKFPSPSKRKSPEELIEKEAHHTQTHKNQCKRQKVLKEGKLQCCEPFVEADGREKVVRIRHYDTKSVQKFIASQKAKRREQKLNDLKEKELEKKRIEEHLKNLPQNIRSEVLSNERLAREAIATRNFDVSEAYRGHSSSASGNFDEIRSKLEIESKSKPSAQYSHSVDPAEISAASTSCSNHAYETESPDRRKECRKKKERMSSEAISKTVKECERQIMLSGASSEIEGSTSSDISSNIEGIKKVSSMRKERIASLHQMALRLTKTIETEEQALDRRINCLQDKMSKLCSKSKRSKHLNPPNLKYYAKETSSLNPKNLSVEEFIAKMTAMLPKTSSSNVLRPAPASKGASDLRNAQSFAQTADFNYKSQSQTSKIDHKYHVTPLKIPSLTHPSIPYLSFHENKVINQSNRKYNPCQKGYFKPKLMYSPLEMRSAIVIQSYFRGYMVRKTTSSLLAKKVRSRKYHTLRNLKISPLVAPKASSAGLHSKLLESQRPESCIESNKINWSDLEKRLRKESEIVVPPLHEPDQKKQLLPNYIQPFFDLTETGDINAFIESCPADRNRLPQDFIKLHGRDQCHSKENKDSYHFRPKENILAPLEEPIPLSHRNSFSHNKETQTVQYYHSKFDSKKGKRLSDDGDEGEVDLKYLNKVPHPSVKSVSSHKFPTDSSKLLSRQLTNFSSSSITNRAEGRGVNEKDNNNADIGNNFPPNHEIIPSCASSIDSSYSTPNNFSLSQHSLHSKEFVEEPSSSFSPSETPLRGKPLNNIDKPLLQGYQFSPSNLSCRVNAELVYQDTLGSALNHLQELQNLRSLSQMQEKSSKLFGAINYATNKNENLNESLMKVQEENLNLKRAKEFTESEIKKNIQSDVERLEKETQSRINKLEQEVRERAMKVINPVAMSPYADHGVIATATAAAVGASIKALERIHPNYSSMKKSTSPHSPKEESVIYTDEFSELTPEEISSVEKVDHDNSFSINLKSIRSNSNETFDHSGSSSKNASPYLTSTKITSPNLTSEASDLKTSTASKLTISSIQENISLKGSGSSCLNSDKDVSSDHSSRSISYSKAGSDIEERCRDKKKSTNKFQSPLSSENITTEYSHSMLSKESSDIKENAFATTSNSQSSKKDSNKVFPELPSNASSSINENILSTHNESPSSNSSSERIFSEYSPNFSHDSTTKVSSVIKESISEDNHSQVSYSHSENDLSKYSSHITENLASNMKTEKPERLGSGSTISKTSCSHISSESLFDIPTKESLLSKTLRQDSKEASEEDMSKFSRSSRTESNISEQLVSDANGKKIISVCNSVSELISTVTPSTAGGNMSNSKSSSNNDQSSSKNGGVSYSYQLASRDVGATVDTSGTYSESFEPDSATSDTSESSIIKSKIQRTVIEIESHTLKNSSGPVSNKKDELDLPSSSVHSQTDTPRSTKGGALHSTLKLLESLQKEEQIRFSHQKAVFKLQEQSLVEEARLKLASLNSESGSNVRKKQRAILLQLREQRAHLRRLIETQNLAAQQTNLIFSQHHQLLSSSSNLSSLMGNRMLSSRVQSPITNRILDLSLSSSDDLENVSNLTALKGLAKSNLEATSGEDDKPLEDKTSKYANENKASESVSLKGKDRIYRKEDKKKYKEKYGKNQFSGQIVCNKENTSDSSFVEGKTDDFEVISYSSPNEGSTYTSEDKVEGLTSHPSMHSTAEETSDEQKMEDKDQFSFQDLPKGKNLKAENEKDFRHKDKETPNLSPTPVMSERTNSSEEATLAKRSLDMSKPISENKRKKENISEVPFTIRVPLSPRPRLRQHRRQSSESDDSFSLSQNETASDMSDNEGKLVALKEELAFRKAEAEKLKKERKKILKERLITQEQALRKQIAAYDNYISQTKLDIEREAKELQNNSSVKPLIKKPRVAGSKKLQKQHDHSFLFDQSDHLEESSNIESLGADYSSILETSLKSGDPSESSVSSSSSKKAVTISQSDETKSEESIKGDSNKDMSIEKKYLENSSPAGEKDDTNILSIQSSNKDVESEVSPNRDIVESDHSASQESSTKTILHSPKKSSSIKDSRTTDQSTPEEITEPTKESEPEYEETFTEPTNGTHSSPETSPPASSKEKEDFSGENKLEIFLPDIEEKTEQGKDSDGDEAITTESCEDIPMDKEDSLSFMGKMEEKEELSLHDDKVISPQTDKEKKAESLADSILQSLVKDSLKCMTHLLSNNEKEAKELVVLVEGSGDQDLKSGNLSEEFEGEPTLDLKKKDKVLPPIPEEKMDCLSLDEDRPLSSFARGFGVRNESADANLIKALPTNELEKKSPNEVYSTEQRINSPVEATNEERNDGVSPEELAFRLLNVQTDSSELEGISDINDTFVVSSCEGTWLEGDFWKTGDTGVKSQKELKEEEELLNAEIARLEELQRFKERYPNLIIREVPNKPPPPYTPPKGEVKITHVDHLSGQDTPRIVGCPDPQTPSNTISVPHRLSKADLGRIASDIVKAIPTKQEDIINNVEEHFSLLYNEWQSGNNPSLCDFPSSSSRRDGDLEEDDDDFSEVSETTFQRHLFHLTRQLVAEVYDLHHTPPQPPWVAPVFSHPSKPWQVARNLKKENLWVYVFKKVRILMGWEPPLKKESNMVKWARKKKEMVDQILVQELQMEEISWTRYDEEELHEKIILSNDIFSDLIDDSIAVFNKILQNKFSRSCDLKELTS